MRYIKTYIYFSRPAGSVQGLGQQAAGGETVRSVLPCDLGGRQQLRNEVQDSGHDGQPGESNIGRCLDLLRLNPEAALRRSFQC